jgi:Protein of unknown function (DUF3253)
LPRPASLVIDAPLVRHRILAMLALRDADSSLCPSEVARSLAPDGAAGWRGLMPVVREVACQLASRQRVRVTRGGVPLNLNALGRGPVRLSRGRLFREHGKRER